MMYSPPPNNVYYDTCSDDIPQIYGTRVVRSIDCAPVVIGKTPGTQVAVFGGKGC